MLHFIRKIHFNRLVSRKLYRLSTIFIPFLSNDSFNSYAMDFRLFFLPNKKRQSCFKFIAVAEISLKDCSIIQMCIQQHVIDWLLFGYYWELSDGCFVHLPFFMATVFENVCRSCWMVAYEIYLQSYRLLSSFLAAVAREKLQYI